MRRSCRRRTSPTPPSPAASDRLDWSGGRPPRWHPGAHARGKTLRAGHQLRSPPSNPGSCFGTHAQVPPSTWCTVR
jgi:hypothetical protein